MKLGARWASVMAVILMAAPAVLAAEGELTLKAAEKALPEGVADPIKGAVQGTSIQLLNGEEPVYEFWLAKSITLTAAPDAKDALASVPEMALLGIAQIGGGEERDYRDDELPAAVYTMRLSIQPKDGNHLGTSEFPYFAVLIPAEKDTKLEGFESPKAMVKTSQDDTVAEHPVIVSLRPSTDAGPFPKLREPALEHKSVAVEVPAKSADGADTKIVFEIVYAGVGEL
ncbi:MAG: hypothetical protein HYV27_24735 [Candidatus Hydrogenedentes bacterium]|nr:hypothetical protein [Candidatus Hydrogenedentota bacterium]